MRFFALLLTLLLMATVATAQTLPNFDFTRPEDVQGWQAAHDIAKVEGGAEGLTIEINGGDPYAIGPARDYPVDTPLWLTVRLKSEQDGGAQIFYFKTGPSEADSVRFPVKANVWQEVRVPLPALGPGYRLRFDPPGTNGKMVLASLRFEPRILLPEPVWPKPTVPDFSKPAFAVRSGDVTLAHGGRSLGDFTLNVGTQRMAVGFNHSLIGYMHNGQARWIDLSTAKTTISRKRAEVVSIVSDADGATWTLRQSFRAGKTSGFIEVESSVAVNQKRIAVFLPMLMLLPGAGSFGETKGQALFPGLEYLDNELSSSEADLIGPQARRQVADTAKITMPFMAVQNGGAYVGLAWQPQNNFCALFDSPDRIFKSGGHVLGVLFPGSDGLNRVEGNLLPYQGEPLEANQPLTLRAALFGGRGNSAVDAVQHFVKWHGLPSLPNAGMNFQEYSALTTAGWLDSALREGDSYRHAYAPGGNFAPHPVADGAVLMEWLAQQSDDTLRATRLNQAALATLGKVPANNYLFANVSHVNYPVAPLLYGHVDESANRAAQSARDLLGRFEADGTILYRKRDDGPDYGKTHFAPDANGLTAQIIASQLDMACFAGDKPLIAEYIKKLRALDEFSNTVPRGAQTWEVPLHTPDILASAHLVRAYLRGYELTGETQFLDKARHWAWTGVPFVYLVNPTAGHIGPYNTIAVLGATGWQAPNWMGLPVQWCGLVYGDALYRLAQHDPIGPWQQLADGIAIGGIQHTYPMSDAAQHGLLPDSFSLRPQVRNGPAINPGTVQTQALRFYGKPEIYDFQALRTAGLLVHAPGAISVTKEDVKRVAFKVQGWVDRSYFILINGLQKEPKVRLNGQPLALAAPQQFVAEKGRLILQVQGTPTIEIDLAP